MCTIGCLLWCSHAINAQLDSIHYLPPAHAAAEYGEHYLYLTTPHTDSIVINITLGNGQSVLDNAGFPLDSVMISNSTPQAIFLGRSIAAGSDMPVLAAKNELNQPISHKGLILRSDKVFYVNYRMRSGLQGASLTSKGENALGMDFRIGHIPGAANARVPASVRRSNFVSMMATEDNTQVTVSEMDPDLSYEDTLGFNRSGGSIQVTLNAGESYVLSAYYGVGWPAANAMGLMGSRVTASSPVAVTCGSWLGSPFNFNNQDIGIDQIVPIEYTGDRYVLVRGDGPATLEIPIVVAFEDSTEISVNDAGTVTMLNAGEHYLVSASYYTPDENVYLHGNKPFYMYQSLAGANDSRTGGLNFIPPLGCSSEKSIDNIMDIDLIGSTPFQGKLFIVAETGEDVWVNGNQIPDLLLKPILGNPDFKTIKSPNLSGLIDVRSTGAIQVGIFGRNNAAGWAGYFSGFKKAVPPEVKLNTTLLCNQQLYLDAEHAQRVEWYFNDSLIATGSKSLKNLSPGKYHVVGFNKFCRDIKIDTSPVVTVREPLRFTSYSNAVPCQSSNTGKINVDVDSGGYPPFEFSLEGQTGFSRERAWDSLYAGEYILAIKDSLGCLLRDTIRIENEGKTPEVVLQVPDSITCASPNVSLSSSGSSTGPEYQYSWTNPEGDIISNDTVAVVNKPGLYVLKVTNQRTGCSHKDSIMTVSDKTSPQIETGGGGWLTCVTTERQLWVSHNLDKDHAEITWVSPVGHPPVDSASQTISVSLPGDYTVSVLDQKNGCIADTIIHVTIDTAKPQIQIDPPDTLTCDVKMVRLGSDYLHHRNANLYWSTVDGNIIEGDHTNAPLIDQSGTYQLVVSDTVNGCSDSLSITVVQDTIKPYLTLPKTARLTCRDSVIVVHPGIEVCPECSDLWTTINGQNISDPDHLVQQFTSPGNYQLTRKNNRTGCLSIDSILIDKAPEPELIEVTSYQGSCDQQWGSISIDTVVGGEGPYKYSIDGGMTFSNENLFEQIPPGEYQVIIRDVNGCELSYSSKVFIPQKVRIISIEDLILSLGEKGRFMVEVNLEENEISDITWHPSEDLSCRDCLNPEVLGIKGGQYQIVVEDIYGCRDSATLTLKVDRDIDVFIPNVFSPNGDALNDGFTAFVKEGQARRIKAMRVFSRWGELVFETTDIPVNQPSLGWQGLFNNELLDPAVFAYTIEIEFIDGSTEVYSGDVTLLR
ncbi:MAG: gliding motility-associated C-terminal domain-containing protein [Saprospiraceae bacterium]|nr:gliding motility-associated C-terminal domain-containing protein [Saprospiraceae bacterium]